MRKLGYAVLGIVLVGLLWYLFLKPYEYTVRFKVNTFPGPINQMLKLWGQSNENSEELVQNGSIYELTQRFKFNDSIHKYHWYIQPLTDSTSRVRVDIHDVNNSLLNKIKVPFSDTDFEKGSRKTIKGFISLLNDHIGSFKVKVVGKDSIAQNFCAYVNISSSQAEKAGGMMANYIELTGFLKDNGLKENGFPYVEVTQWNQKNDSISYNFCYPLVYQDSLPESDRIKFKKSEAIQGIKAIYNGNYITSDRAWYALLDYAEKNDIKVSSTPIEYFYNNPNQGGNELEWKAEIFLPIKQSNE